MIKHTPVLFALVLISLLSCKNFSNSSEGEDKNKVSESFKEAHTSRNSLDWHGTYVGELPCADCEGIQTIIQLNSNLTYKKKSIYLGKSKDTFQVEGKFKWDDSGNKIYLKNDNQSQVYKVEENALVALDQDGNKIQGALSSKYRLEKLLNSRSNSNHD